MSKNKKIIMIVTIILIIVGILMAIFVKPKNTQKTDKLNVVATTFNLSVF